MIFISYSRLDKKIAREIIDELNKEWSKNIYFIDVEDIEIGHINFIDKINEALEKANIFIPIVTTNYLKSEICKIEMNAFFLSTLSTNFKKIIPFYPENIINKTPLIYKGINSIIEKPISELIDIIKSIKEGKAISRLESPLVNKLTGDNIFPIGVELTFLYYNKHISNPRIKITLSNRFNWIKHFGSYEKVWDSLNINWEPLIGIKGLSSKTETQVKQLTGIYFAGLKQKIIIWLHNTNTNLLKSEFLLNLFNGSLLYIKNGGDIKKRIPYLFDKIEILNGDEVISEINFNKIK